MTIIRSATTADLSALGVLGAALARQHYTYDTSRFAFFEKIEGVFAEFFAAQIEREDATVIVAEQNGTIIGYAYVAVEHESVTSILERSAWLHDIYLLPEARGTGAGTQLLDASINAARTLGSRGLMISVSPHNSTARDLFLRRGFRPTMEEMRLELAQHPLMPSPITSDRSLLIAVAGRYSAPTAEERQSNLDAMNRAAVEVLRRGHIPIIGVNLALPVVALLDEAERYEAIMRISLAAVGTCDAILMVSESPGANRERDLLVGLGCPVYTSLDQLPPASSTTLPS